jgi:hypothetical protein
LSTIKEGACFPLIEKDWRTGLLKLKVGGYSFTTRWASCSLVPEGETAAANSQYQSDITKEKIARWEAEWAAESAPATSSEHKPASRPTQAQAQAQAQKQQQQQQQQPTGGTIEILYTWDVTVHIGRKYWATKDKYELYSSLTTEVQAKTRSEAERIAASKSYTTNSALFGSRIEVAPAGTEGAKFRVYNCEATRQ